MWSVNKNGGQHKCLCTKCSMLFKQLKLSWLNARIVHEKKICSIDFIYYVTETRRPFFDYDQKKETVADFVLAWQGEFGMENNPDAVLLCCTPVGIFHTIENFKRKIKPYSFLMIGLNLKPCLS